MEESIEQEIKKLWESSNGPIVEKLERLQIRLIWWASLIKKGRNGLKNKLMKDLDDLLTSDRDADIMAKLIDIRIQLNMKIDKDEIELPGSLISFPRIRGVSSIVDCGLSGERETEEYMSREIVQGSE
ncbi:hypothetical protein GOBAR_AA24383 [Gossypium barbadense]|uniref:Uncharacterized protein n=1 Tax=Gossypium barbadense TaxID=3634 RepID=A0A2P5WZ00_GOSBA|nr:hypothetical protein GOBAR_AA24383 [Gossypium barbadense]